MFDASGFLALPYSLKLKYENYWNTFERIQLFNSNVSTIREGGGNTEATYYQFQTYVERDAYQNGQFLHQKRYPGYNWNSITGD